MMQSSDRKRPRSTSPVPMVSIGKPRAGVPDGKSLARRVLNPGSRNGAFNDLLRITSSHDINYSLDGDHILKALASVFYEVIGWDLDGDDDDEDGDVDEAEDTTRRNEENEDSNASEADGQNRSGGDDDDSNGDDEGGVDQGDDEGDLGSKFAAKQAWIGHVTDESEKWARFCEATLSKEKLAPDDMRYLEIILTIIRNLSFVSANLRLLAYSCDIVAILTGCLYEQSYKQVGSFEDNNSNATNLTLNSLTVLTNLAPHLDVTGQQLFCDKLFLMSTGPGASPEEGTKLPDPSTFGQVTDGSWGFGSLYLAKKLDTKEDVVQDVTKDMLLQLTNDYLVQVWSIFPALGKVLTDTTVSRTVTLMAVDLLQEFINQARVGIIGAVEEDPDKMPNMRAIFVYIPDTILQRLGDFLYIPRQGSDALEYVDPTMNIVTRVAVLKLLAGYDATVDTDIRDRALDVLVPLMELDSPRIAKRLGSKENGMANIRFLDAIFPILTTQSGRNEAPLLAAHLLRELSKAKENKQGCLYLQERIIALASKEPRVAHLAFNHMFVDNQNDD